MKDMYETTRGYGQPEIDAQGYYGMDMQERWRKISTNHTRKK